MASDFVNMQLTAIFDSLQGHATLFDAFEQVQSMLLSMFHVQRVRIFQRRHQQQDLVLKGPIDQRIAALTVPISPASIAGFVALSRQPIFISDPYDRQTLHKIHPRLRFEDTFDQHNYCKTQNILCVPIIYANVVIGVLQLVNKANGFEQADIESAMRFADMLGQQFRYDLGGTQHPFDALVHRQLLTPMQLSQLLDNKCMQREPQAVIETLISDYHITTDDIGQALSMYYQVPFIAYQPDLYHTFNYEHKLNLPYLKRNLIAIIADLNETTIILMAEPNNASLVMEVEHALCIEDYDIALGLPQHILQYLGISSGGEATAALSEILDEIGTVVDEVDEPADEVSDNAPAIVRLVNRVLHDAKRLNASDIHIDPEKSGPTRVRMRVDGVCRDINQIPASHHNAVVARIKIMANLNIAEKRLPQDGKLAVKISTHLVEVRVATLPTVAGEGVVMRILATGGAMPIAHMNLHPRNLQTLQVMLAKPHGILLIVGPTGSGKTTTLHAILSYLNTADKKIWTAEDPVEITQAGLQQVQVNPNIGFTFANALRAFLRADPDIILIGEMRDKETAHAGIEASLTGHMVLSTLHTNSAPETITRLLDLGLDPVNFSDACVGILAQRLVRLLCSECKQPYVATTNEIAFITRHYGNPQHHELNQEKAVTLYRAVGCEHCGDTGYKGRTGVHELLNITPTLRGLVYKQAAVDALKAQAKEDGMRTLIQDGLYKVLKGDTDITQVRTLGAVE